MNDYSLLLNYHLRKDLAMIHIKKEFIENISLLHVFQAKQAEQPLPTVIYYHGFYGEKESSLTLAYKIAMKGFRVLLPDSLFHGERQEDMTKIELDLAFWDIVLQNVKELAMIKDYLEKNKLTIPGRIGLGGTSMGGITTFGALRKYEWIKAAAVLMGTPKMIAYAHLLIDEFNRVNDQQISETERAEVIERLSAFDLSKEPEKLNNRPLFIWHGVEDQVVPFQHSQSFYENINHLYDHQEHLLFFKEKGRAHHISRLSIAKAANWFERFM